jgi:hypothetical protein
MGADRSKILALPLSCSIAKVGPIKACEGLLELTRASKPTRTPIVFMADASPHASAIAAYCPCQSSVFSLAVRPSRCIHLFCVIRHFLGKP